MKDLILLVILGMLFLSCSEKDSFDDEEAQQDPPAEHQLSVKFLSGYLDADSVEIIIHDPCNAILLDSMLSADSEHNLRYKSISDTVNLSFIYRAGNRTVVETYFQVVPISWEVPLNGELLLTIPILIPR